MDSDAGFPQQQYFNFYPAYGASYYQQTENNTQHPGTLQHTLQCPGTIHHFSQHPGTDPFLTQHVRMTHFPAAQCPGLNQFSSQHPGTTPYSTPYPGQISQNTRTSKFPGPPLYTPYLGTGQYTGTNQLFEEKTPYTAGPRFHQTATQFNSETLCTGGNVWKTAGNSGTPDNFNSFNNSKLFEETACSSIQPMSVSCSSNACQFPGLIVKDSESTWPQNVSLFIRNLFYHPAAFQ